MKREIRKSGLLLVFKNRGITSFDVIKKIKSAFAVKKIGHGGTLDPFAEGLLLIFVNRATRLTQFFLNSPKGYIARLFIGFSTDTLDCEGEMDSISKKIYFSEEDILKVFKEFIGDIVQKVPSFSAAKYKGKPLYHYSRRKISVPEKKKNVRIYSLKLLKYVPPFLDFEVSCSGGTYVRSLGRDISRSLNTEGHLISLKRIFIKDFKVENSMDLNYLLNLSREEFERKIIPLGDILVEFPIFFFDEEKGKKFLNGVEVKLDGDCVNFDGKYFRIFSNEKFIGIGKVYRNLLKPYIVFK